jgi:hypothetical protein
LLPPLLGVRNPSKRKPTSEKVNAGVATHGVTVGSKRQPRQASGIIYIRQRLEFNGDAALLM